MKWPEATERTILLDPCAGEGEAIATLRELWAAQSAEAYAAREPSRWERPETTIVLTGSLMGGYASSLGDDHPLLLVTGAQPIFNRLAGYFRVRELRRRAGLAVPPGVAPDQRPDVRRWTENRAVEPPPETEPTDHAARLRL